MSQTINQFLKRSGFVVGIVRTIRAGLEDIKKVYWSLIRKQKVSRYLHQNSLRKLQLGASYSLIPGWLNTDLLPTSRGVVYLDVTRPFPFDDNTFDYVYCEHVIEHIEHQSAISMLHECFRVLKPGGKIRISTPDLTVYTSLHSKEKTPSQNHYIEWVSQRFLPEVDYCKEVFVINNAFRAWGHQFLYDVETLRVTLARSGFEDMKYYQPGVSNDENLRGVESHGSSTEGEEINRFEAFAIEGRAPNPKS